MPQPGSRLSTPSTRCSWQPRSAAGCELYRDATQVVMGRGDPDARLLLVGEQPGDSEDRQGKPFVGPAGRLLVGALAQAGVDPGAAYVTNAVKHFRFTTKGKQRIHATPSRWNVTACGPWLLAELDAVRPGVVVILGATAGQALFGPSFRVGTSRGRALEAPGGWALPGPAADVRRDGAPVVGAEVAQPRRGPRGARRGPRGGGGAAGVRPGYVGTGSHRARSVCASGWPAAMT